MVTKAFKKKLSIHDVKTASVNYQWSDTADLTVTDVESAEKVFFLMRAEGTGLSVVSDGVTIISGVSSIDLSKYPLRLSQNGFSITGTSVTFILGFYVPVLKNE